MLLTMFGMTSAQGLHQQSVPQEVVASVDMLLYAPVHRVAKFNVALCMGCAGSLLPFHFAE